MPILKRNFSLLFALGSLAACESVGSTDMGAETTRTDAVFFSTTSSVTNPKIAHDKQIREGQRSSNQVLRCLWFGAADQAKDETQARLERRNQLEQARDKVGVARHAQRPKNCPKFE